MREMSQFPMRLGLFVVIVSETAFGNSSTVNDLHVYSEFSDTSYVFLSFVAFEVDWPLSNY